MVKFKRNLVAQAFTSRPANRSTLARLSRLLCGLGLLLLTVSPAFAAGEAPAAKTPPIPLFAYYYIWLDTGSWDRAKTDFPVLGRYSSDDTSILREHVRLAKQAGINGFIVSWKNTRVLTPRLEQLIQIADAEDFKLAIIYQGLDVNRKPIPATTVAADLDFFAKNYANHAAFSTFDRPLVIWSGSWEFSQADVAKVTGPRRNRLAILASARSVDDYERLAKDVDGNAYYWSSVDPDTNPAYPAKLAAMAQAVHAHHGLWIAPAAPGFDARGIGGSRIVDRKNGETLRQQLDAAMQSAPDAIGLISWNEFSENTHVEPSVNNGDRYLQVVADARNVSYPVIDFDSSEPGGNGQFRAGNLALLGAVGALFLGSLGIIVRRNTRGGPPT